MNIEELIEGLHELEVSALSGFAEVESCDVPLLAERARLSRDQARSVAGWLVTKDILQVVSEEVTEEVTLTPLGQTYATQRTPEMRVLTLLERGADLTVEQLAREAKLEGRELSSAVGELKVAGVISIGPGGTLRYNPDAPLDHFVLLQDTVNRINREGTVSMEKLEEEAQAQVRSLARKRGKSKEIFRIDERVHATFALTEIGKQVVDTLASRGPSRKEITALTPEMIKEGTWRDAPFRRYSLDLEPPRSVVGQRHPYGQFLDFVRGKLLAMGFKEMRGSLVETEFWNMDALYMPQFHPAREIHDVYFVKDPQYSTEAPEPFESRVAKTHQNGWETGSTGWGYTFDIQRSRRLLLRSQGTVLSVRTLASGPEIPGKYFAIARCFRYDQVDATHAADFYQIEGIVVEHRINLRVLLGLLDLFAREIARATRVKFVPGYFPFTEPSVEVHVHHPQLGWIELGGAGIFRPEVTLPMGVTVPVIAWGLGLDRMAMVALDIHDIRDLFSPDLGFLREKTVHV
jgi:phenylalanyl-tRNA synthetase alpha chain